MDSPSSRFTMPPTSAEFDVVCLEVNAQPTEGQLSGATYIIGPPYFGQRGLKNGGDLYTPSISVGSLVVALHGGECTHAGIISGISDDPRIPGCFFDMWPLEASVYFYPYRYHPLTGQKLGATWFSCKSQDGKPSIVSRISPLDKAAASQLRELIGAVAPDEISSVFWSDSERHYFAEKMAAHDLYINAANDLLQQLNS